MEKRSQNLDAITNTKETTVIRCYVHSFNLVVAKIVRNGRECRALPNHAFENDLANAVNGKENRFKTG